jgi:hypothetical protein
MWLTAGVIDVLPVCMSRLHVATPLVDGITTPRSSEESNTRNIEATSVQRPGWYISYFTSTSHPPPNIKKKEKTELKKSMP